MFVFFLFFFCCFFASKFVENPLLKRTNYSTKLKHTGVFIYFIFFFLDLGTAQISQGQVAPGSSYKVRFQKPFVVDLYKVGELKNYQNSFFFFKFLLAADGGICVNDQMETNVANVFAAGDVCTASWPHAPHWIQVKIKLKHD